MRRSRCGPSAPATAGAATAPAHPGTSGGCRTEKRSAWSNSEHSGTQLSTLQAKICRDYANHTLKRGPSRSLLGGEPQLGVPDVRTPRLGGPTGEGWQAEFPRHPSRPAVIELRDL